MLVAEISQRSLVPLSVNKNSFASPMCQTFTPGPRTTPRADVPNCPCVGGANAEVSKYLLSARWSPERLGLWRMLGRRVTMAGELVVKAMPTGSGPLQSGVRYWPVCVVNTPLISHPPTAKLSGRDTCDIQCRPRPN